MYETVRSGQPVRLSARQVNAWNRTAETIQKGNEKNLGDSSNVVTFNPAIIKVQNKTGTSLGKFSILAVGKPINSLNDIDDARKEVLNHWIRCEGNAPTGSDTETICVTLQPTGENVPVKAVVTGPIGCVVNITDTSHGWAKAIVGDTGKLESSEVGTIKILATPSEIGEAFCYVLLGVGGVGGGTSTLYGIVMESISQPADATAELPSGMGKVRILGKTYPTQDEHGDPVEPVYDDCGANFLSSYCDEIIPIGTSVEVHGPYLYDNPDFDQNIDESETNPRQKAYYMSAKTEGVYVGKIKTAITGPNDETEIDIKNGDDTHTLIKITFPILRSNQTLPADEGVWARRDYGENGEQLFIFRARCV